MVFNASYIAPRMMLLKHVHGNDLTVLDVGCATGANGQYLLDNAQASEVYGFEFDPDMAVVAQGIYTNVVAGDVEQADLEAALGAVRFDYILMGDVLEHLRDPWRILSDMTSYLKPTGKIILSIPNVQHIDVFIHVWFKGVWPHNERGIFDKTHLRFFTRKTILSLIESAQLEPTTMQRLYRLRDAKKSKFKHSPLEWLISFIFKNLYTFQYVFVCQRRSI